MRYFVKLTSNFISLRRRSRASGARRSLVTGGAIDRESHDNLLTLWTIQVGESHDNLEAERRRDYDLLTTTLAEKYSFWIRFLSSSQLSWKDLWKLIRDVMNTSHGFWTDDNCKLLPIFSGTKPDENVSIRTLKAGYWKPEQSRTPIFCIRTLKWALLRMSPSVFNGNFRQSGWESDGRSQIEYFREKVTFQESEREINY